MCVVSMITDWHQQRWPNPNDWTKRQYEEFKEIIEEAKKIDEKKGLPDCPRDDKAEFLKKLAQLFEEYEIKKK